MKSGCHSANAPNETVRASSMTISNDGYAVSPSLISECLVSSSSMNILRSPFRSTEIIAHGCVSVYFAPCFSPSIRAEDPNAVSSTSDTGI